MKFVYIDGANLHQWSKSWWIIDYARFRQWLKDKYKTEKIYLFMGYIKGNEQLYNFLQEQWYTIIFKETLEIAGKVKWNCDAELVVKAVSDFYEVQTKNAVLVSWDGDFACLLDFFKEKSCPIIVLSPNKKYCSYLLKKRNIPIIFLEELKSKFTKNPQ